MNIIDDYKWIREQDKAEMRELILKRQNGIKRMMFENKVLVWEVFSKRPYRLGQSCDGSIDYCVFALFYAFCKAKKLNPDEIHQKAYPDEKNDFDWDNIVKKANLEGVKYPGKWDKKAVEGLLESLAEINNHSLATVLSEISNETIG